MLKFLKLKPFIFILMSGLVLSLNKYVLSVLHFTLPTVFQGWQTFVCVVLLTLLLRFGQLRIEFNMDRKTFLALVVPFTSFTLANVAGSKALAKLPVGIFLTGPNIVQVFLMIQESTKVCKVVFIALLFSFLTLFLIDERTDLSGWIWLVIHMISSATYIFTVNRVSLAHESTMYFCNLSSVIVLLPISIYLHEATSAFDHARNAQSEFFVGCVMSGILGTLVQLLYCDLHGDVFLPTYMGINRCLTCILSVCVFQSNLMREQWLIIFSNLVMGCFVFGAVAKPSLISMTTETIFNI